MNAKALVIIPYENQIPVWQDTKTGSNCRALPTVTFDLSLTLRSLYLYREQLKKNIKQSSRWLLIKKTLGGDTDIQRIHQELLEKVNQQILALEVLSRDRR